MATLARHHILVILRTHQVLFLTTLCIDESLSTPRTLSTANTGIDLLSKDILLSSSTVRNTSLSVALTVSETVVLNLRQVILIHHTWAEQAV